MQARLSFRTVCTAIITVAMTLAYASGALALSSRDTFIKGVDISTLQALEDHGVKFYDRGQSRDLLDILRDRGVNWVRIRVWNDPQEMDGYNDADHLVELAPRLKAKGFKLLVDFHYSDFWADPGRQQKPKAWEDLSFPELLEAVYQYTADVLTRLASVGAYPDMVQVGNEIQNGILHPDGRSSNFDNLAALLKEGIRAVRDTTPPGHETKVMLHLANGGDNGLYRWFFDNIVARGVDFDVIGLSYYPYWHGTFKQFKDNINDIAQRYDKEIVVAETAYPYTLEDGDGWANIANEALVKRVGLPASVESQKLVFEIVMNTVAHVPNGKGLGVFYWEPAWIPRPDRSWEGVGWRSGEGNAWENQAMFDFDGNALPSLEAFRYLPGDIPKEPVSAHPLSEVTTAAHVPPELPATVQVLYTDGDMQEWAVHWDPIDPDRLTRVGSFTHHGTVAGLGLPASVTITVVPSVNRVVNGGFEESTSLVGWTVTGTPGAVKVDSAGGGNAHSGQRSANYWYGSPFQFTLEQRITGLRNGVKHVLRAWISGPWPGDESQPQPTVLRMFVKDYGGDPLWVDMENAGWNNWQQYEIAGVVPTTGEATIGFEVQAPANAWGFFDDVEFREDVTVPQWGPDARLRAEAVKHTSVTLHWTPASDESGVTGYKVYRDDTLVAIVPGDTHSYTVSGLSPSTTYVFKVEAGNAADIWTSTGPSVVVTTLGLADAVAAPNPARDQVTFIYDPALEGGTLRIFNVAGRLLRTLPLEADGSTAWDLTDASGRPLASGLYLWTLSDADGTPVTKRPERLVIQR